MKINITYEATDLYEITVKDETTLERLELSGLFPYRLALKEAKRLMRFFDEGDEITAVIVSGTTGEVIAELETE